MSSSFLLLCVGDSHTEAILGADWVGSLAAATRGKLRVVRAGRAGEWAVLIRRRLDQLLAAHPDVAGVTILAGTNDVIATLDASRLGFYRRCFPALKGAEASLSAHTAEVEAMLRALRERAPRCRAAVITLPPIGEDLGDAANVKVQQYNTTLRQLVGRYADSARLVDFHAACVEHLAARATPAPPPAGLPSMSLWGMVWIQVAAVVRRYVFRSSWNAVSRVNGLRLLTDHVHLNDTAAALLVRSLQPFVDELIAGS